MMPSCSLKARANCAIQPLQVARRHEWRAIVLLELLKASFDRVKCMPCAGTCTALAVHFEGFHAYYAYCLKLRMHEVLWAKPPMSPIGQPWSLATIFLRVLTCDLTPKPCVGQEQGRKPPASMFLNFITKSAVRPVQLVSAKASQQLVPVDTTFCTRA